MATYRAVTGVLTALKDVLDARISDLAAEMTNPSVVLLGSQQLRDDPTGNMLGIYLHRISVDPYGRNRYLPPQRPGNAPRPELPVNLHILLVGRSLSASAEITLVAWAMQSIGAAMELDAAHMAAIDPNWSSQERLQIIPEEMSTEDLMRVWDSLPGDYRLSSPYLVKTLRLEPVDPVTQGPPVTSIVLPLEQL